MKSLKSYLVMTIVLCVVFLGTISISAAEPVNLALTATVEASTSFPEARFAAPNAIDGDMGTCWAPEWEDMPKLKITLKEEANIDTIVLYGRFDIETNPALTEEQIIDRTADYIDVLDISIDGKVVKTINDYPRLSFKTPVTVKLDKPVKGKEVLIEVIEGKANPGFTEVQIFAAEEAPATQDPNTPAPTEGNKPETPATGDAGLLFPAILAAAAAFGGLKLKK